MKRQFFSKLLMAAMLVTAVGSFQSCKDYDDDINAVEANVQTLQGQVTTLESALTQAKADLAAAKATADQAVNDAKAAAAAAADANTLAQKANNAIEALATKAALEAEVSALEKAISDVKAALDGKASAADLAVLAGKIDAIDTKLNNLTDGLATVAYVNAEDEKVRQEVKEIKEALLGDIANQKEALDNFKASVTETIEAIKVLIPDGSEITNLSDILVNLATKVKNAEDAIAALQAKVAEIDEVKSSVSELRTIVTNLQSTITNASSSVQYVQAKVQTLNVFIDGTLTSLVLRPTLYYGGIEAIEAIHAEYQPLGFSIYYQDEYTVDNGNKTGGSRIAYDRTTGNGYEITYEYNAKDDLVYKYPTIDAYYHLNPKNVKAEDITGLALNTADKHYVNTTATRGEKTSLDWALDLVGENIFAVENGGILHTWLANSSDIWHRVEQYAHTVTVVSLEANAKASDGTIRTVTSDWAAIARVHQNNFRIADNDAYILHYTTYPHINFTQDTDCGMMDTQQYVWTEQHSYVNESADGDGVTSKYNKDIVHVYRQASQAIDSEYTHLLPWNGTVDLDEVIEVHADHHYYNAEDQIDDASAIDRIYDFPVDLEKLGFERKYTVVNYEYSVNSPNYGFVNFNGTQESQHAHIAADGHTLVANTVVNGKRDAEHTNRSSIGREPLVMIEIIDNNDLMTWNPDHMNWERDSVNNDPKPNLVAVGFIKFKIVDEADPVLLGAIEVMNDAMYASCAGDTILANWYQVEEQILSALSSSNSETNGISKAEFESNYCLRNANGEELTLREMMTIGSNNTYFEGQVYIPHTYKTSIIGTRKNWVDGVNLNTPANWVLPQTQLNEDITEPGFVDVDRYGKIVYTNYDPLHRATNLIGVTYTAEQMLQQLVKRDHRGHYLDSLGNKVLIPADGPISVAMLSQADFYPSVQTKVAAKLVDPNHSGYPEITIVFNTTVYLNKATMNRPLRTANGNWYGTDAKYLNGNIDAYNNGTGGAIYSGDVRRFVVNLQQSLLGQRWFATTTNLDGSTNQKRAFDFFYDEIKDQPNGLSANARAAIQRSKLGKLHGDLYFFTDSWLGDLEEGTPYWHDWNNTNTPLDDKFYADRYLIKVCYTNNPLDTVIWATQDRHIANTKHIGKLGKYLFAYKYIENVVNTPSTIVTPGYINTGDYDLANGQLIAWIDNVDTHQFDLGTSTSAITDADNHNNENVNVHYNYASTFARDLINRAGRYAEANSGTQDGYSKATDNPISARVHLNLFEGDCIPPLHEDTQGYWWTNGTSESLYSTLDHEGGTCILHRPGGVPVMLSNPDFIVRFERPLNVEFATSYLTKKFISAPKDAIQNTYSVTVTYVNQFRNDGGSPQRIFPMDWRNDPVVGTSAAMRAIIGFYQGYNDGNDNLWNGTPGNPATQWFQSREVSRSDTYQKYFFPVPAGTAPLDVQTWNADNVVPDFDHMLTNYGGTEGFYATRASQIGMIIDNFDATGAPATAPNNIASTKFTYLNDLQNRGEFDIIIPMTVKYAWGDITTTGRWQQTVNLPKDNDHYYRNDNMLYILIRFGATVGN